MRKPGRAYGRDIAPRCPDGAPRLPYHVTKLVVAIWVLAVAVRLILINQPYIDHWSWRQSDVAAIARNFFEHGFRFGYPQIDWAGGSAGYVGTEFPILPFLAAICYKFAGIHEWIGRSQSVIFFAISFPFFFLLVREIFGSTAAAWATFFYAFAPLNVFGSRSFMPDVPSLSLELIGLYLFLRWVRHPTPASFYLSAITISLSILIKATSIVIAAPILYLVVAEGADLGPVQRGQVCGGRSQRQRLQLGGVCRRCDLTRGRMVLARASNRREILSSSFLWRRWSSTGKFFVVLGRCATDHDVESHTSPDDYGAHRFTGRAAWKIWLPF